jgi:hypothetical protein
MENIKTIKGIVGGISSIGAMIIVGNVVKATTPATTGKVAKIFINFGTAALASFAGVIAGAAAMKEVDTTIESIDILKKAVKEKENDGEEELDEEDDDDLYNIDEVYAGEYNPTDEDICACCDLDESEDFSFSDKIASIIKEYTDARAKIIADVESKTETEGESTDE